MGPELTPTRLRRAFERLDQLLPDTQELLIGGGAAMILGYGETEATRDVDAASIRSPRSLEDLRPALEQVARELGLAPDWINPYFETYMHVLPADYGARLQQTFGGKRLTCWLLGPEDLLVMKLCAGRQKDERHIRRLIRRKDIDLGLVERSLQALVEKRIPRGQEALDRFDEVRDTLGL